MYVSLASRKRIMTELAKAAASGVVERPSPRIRADGTPLHDGATPRAITAGSLPKAPRAQPNASMRCRFASWTVREPRSSYRSDVV
jgi:hypothetical protein